MTSKIAETVARLCRWMTWYSMTEAVLICCGCAALAIILTYIGVRIIKVMIIGEDWEE